MLETANDYKVSEEEKEFFHENGYVTLKNVISPEELEYIEAQFDRFMRGEVEVEGKDFCDMSAGFDRKPEDFELVNAMLPRRYLPSLKDNVYELRAQSIARQLFGDDMVLDYDQFLGKKPRQNKASFAMHQDMAYWPRKTPDTKTATVSLAITQATPMHGCLQVVPGTHKIEEVRPHRNALSNDGSRDDSHAQTVDLLDGEKIEFCPLEAGDVTVHNEWIIHGSSGNKAKDWRKTYVIAFRSAETVKWEREHGFTHSHNDEVNWDSFEDNSI